MTNLPDLFSDIAENESVSKLLKYTIENFYKLIALGIMFLLKKSIFRVIDYIKFYTRLRNYNDTKEKEDKIQSICDNIRYHFDASRVLYLATHNGTITYTNLHISKITCFVESLGHGIAPIKNQIIGKLISKTYVDYFIKHKSLHYNDIDLVEDEDLQITFINRGVQSFFIFMVSKKDMPLGFIRIEFCHKKNHSKETIDNILTTLEKEAKNIYQIIKP